MSDRHRLPFLLGFAGVLPFAGSTFVLWNGPAPLAGAALTVVCAYAFIILAFLGGVHWGVALSSGRALQYVWSVTPSLVALAASLCPIPVMLAILSAAYIAAGVLDVLVFRRDGPAWYAALRVWLTVIVAPLLLAAAFAPLPTTGTPL